MAALLRVLVQQPRTASKLKQAMGLDPESPSDDRKFRRDLRSLRNAGWQVDSVRIADEDRYRLTVVDHRIRTTFDSEQRAHPARGSTGEPRAAYQDLDPDLEDGVASLGPDGLGVAQHAIRHRCVLHFRYKARERELHPDDVFFSGRHWYVRGYETGTEQEFKTFRLDLAEDVVADAPHSAGEQREPRRLTGIPHAGALALRSSPSWRPRRTTCATSSTTSASTATASSPSRPTLCRSR